eukprot:TRINITY_DN2733_c0_g1_i2.p1 TRINITY_DN2733_c0_g1~~TRINITY_DN2733_c0_g1_i2.p1  ORF type:complete len:577 (-),score=152.73 TRINITY_DN2733_c0_g1_i2:143-1873(-)
MTTVDELYELAAKLNGPDVNASEHSSVYESIIAAAKSEHVNAKKMTAQLIPKYFRLFPDLAVVSINAQFDLCEDEDVEVRIYAVRGLFTLCKSSPEYTPKIVDVLIQMLASTNQLELDAIRQSLIAMFGLDAKGTLNSIFSQIAEPHSEEIREQLILFVVEKIGGLRSTLLHPHPEVERHVADLIKKAMEDVSEQEFKRLFSFLRQLKIFSTQDANKELLEIIAAQLDCVSEVLPEREGDPIQIAIFLMQFSIPFYKGTNTPAAFFDYIQKHLIPHYSELSDSRKLALLKAMAESASFCHNLTARKFIPDLHEILMQAIPQPAAPGQSDTTPLNFSVLECIFYIFIEFCEKNSVHLNRLCGYKPLGGIYVDLTQEESAAKLKDFHARLRQLDGRVKTFGDQCKAAIQKLASNSEESKAKIDALTATLRSTNNINNLIKLLLHDQPQAIPKKGAYPFSWKATATVTNPHVSLFKTQSGESVKITTKESNAPAPTPAKATTSTPVTKITPTAKAITASNFVSKTFQNAILSTSLQIPQVSSASPVTRPQPIKRATPATQSKAATPKKPRGTYVPPGRR